MRKKILTIMFSFLFFTLSIKSARAAYFSVSPASSTVSSGQTFTVDLNLNTESVSASGCDVVMTFNSSIIKVQNVSFGSSPIFSSTNTSTPDNVGGKLTINSSVISSAFAFSGSGKLATITFSAEGAGTSLFSFSCTAGSRTDTNVWNTQAQDVANCGLNVGGSYTVTSSSSSPTATPQPTTVPTSSVPQPTPVVPVAGNFSLTGILVIVGTVFIISAAKIFGLFF